MKHSTKANQDKNQKELTMATTAIQVTLAERTVADLYNMIAGVREAAVAKHPRGAGGNYRLVAVSADRVLSHEFGCEPLFLIDACPSKKQIVGYAKDMAERFPEVDEFVIDLDADIYSREMGRDDKGAFIELEQTGEGFDCTVAAVTRGPAPTTPPPAPKTPKVAPAAPTNNKEWWEEDDERWLPDPTKNGWSMRDSKQRQCYRSEWAVDWKRFPKEQSFETTDEVERYLDGIMATEWFKRRWPKARRPQVKPGRQGMRSAHASFNGSMTLPGWARCTHVILHELGHVLTSHASGPGHGRKWARTFLELVHFALGGKAEKALKDSFKAHKVQFNLPRRMSAAAKAAAAERLQKALGNRAAELGQDPFRS